jgi:hypothetical protein
VRAWKTISIITTILLLAFLTLLILKRRPSAVDLAAGFHVLDVDLTEGRENIYRYSIPTTNITQTTQFETMVPTNVLWVLFERPMPHDSTLRWVFTNLHGQKMVSRINRTIWGGATHFTPSGLIQAFPAPIPDVKEILDRTILFEIETTGQPAFIISIP